MLMMQFETKAQDRWKFYNSLAVMYGQYDNALLMDKQNGISVHVSGDCLNQAGFRVGVQSTKINLNQVYGLSSADQQNQENYLLSIYLNQAFKDLPGYLTFKLDAHQAHNNSSNSFSHAQALAPEIEWLSNTQKFRINWSYANSRYVNLKPVHQVSTGFSYRMNNDKDIVSGRVYHIRNLEPNMTLGHDRLVSSEVRFTHLLSHRNPIIPNAISIGLENGRKILNIDMATQVIYNLPIMQIGGETVSATWKVDKESSVTLLAGRSRYLFSPIASIENKFSLTIFSAQLSTAW